MKKRENYWRQGLNLALIIVIAIIIALMIKNTTSIKLEMPVLEKGVGLGMVLVFGLLTSMHCLGMCGGLMLTQCVTKADADAPKTKRRIVLPPVLYNLGRIISYTIVGAVIGGLGQVLSLSGFLKGLIPIIGGVFMILMALNVLGIFPFLRHLQFGAPKGVVKNIRKGEKGPFVLGLLTGIMPCGPLQMAEMYALTTGSVVWGALSMLVFALGTVPCLLLLGVFGSFMTKKFSRAVLQCSATVIIVLGVLMIGKGLAMNGINNPLSPNMPAMSTSAGAAASGSPGDCCAMDGGSK